MIRVVIDIEEYGNVLGTKEAVTMALEHLGSVRIVKIETGGKSRDS